MDSLKSFKGYGKMDPAEDREFRRKTKTRIILIAVAVLLLIAIIAGVAISLSVNKRNSGDNSSSPQSPASASSSIKAICSVTRYPDSCFASLSSNSSTISADPAALFQLSLAVASRSISKLSSFISTLKIPTTDTRLQAAINDCKELLEDAVDRLSDSAAVFTSAKPGEKILSDSRISDLKTWLSATITDQETCLDGFEGTGGGFREKLEAAMVNSTQFASNSLAIVSGIVGIMEKLHFPINRKLLGATGRRRVLLADKTGANVTVARDGSGKAKSVQEAVDMVPRRSLRPFVIYVKEGEYKENVVVDKNKWNVVMVGDGMYKTIVTGDKNFVDGTPTFSTATVAVTGRGFVAKDIGFRNSAGGAKHQAVALRSGSDRSVFHRCSFDGFQDTLYAHSNRQFYRDSHIIGTVDFIFGDAAAVFQNCSILPRQPLPNQSNTITAQGRKDPNQNTAIAIHGCTIKPFRDAPFDRPTFLGRPWKNYSTTVVMKSDIGPLVDPAGWMPWVPGTVPPETIDYAEFRNTGAGAGVAGRVTWPGYRPAIAADEAAKFAVGSFFDGDEWIAEAGVQFDSDL